MNLNGEGFLMDLDTAMTFFQICHEMGLDTQEERTVLLRLLVKEKQAGYLRDVAEYVKDKNVMAIKRKKDRE